MISEAEVLEYVSQRIAERHRMLAQCRQCDEQDYVAKQNIDLLEWVLEQGAYIESCMREDLNAWGRARYLRICTRSKGER